MPLKIAGTGGSYVIGTSTGARLKKLPKRRITAKGKHIIYTKGH